MSIDQYDRDAMRAAGLRPPIHNSAVGKKDLWLVVSSNGDRVVEGWPEKKQAERACKVFNLHAKQCGYPANYRTVPRPEVKR